MSMLLKTYLILGSGILLLYCASALLGWEVFDPPRHRYAAGSGRVPHAYHRAYGFGWFGSK